MVDKTSANSSRLEKSKKRLEQAVSRLEKAMEVQTPADRLNEMRLENAALRDATSTVSKRLDKVIGQLKTSVES
ncbi:MAG: hypothetical protein OQJ97_09725 [Rhodospirillales bacterium]|nr:hypothetical protein [Rhodospirillales bacterium]